MALLNDRGIVARDFRAGSRSGAGDTLILCLSSAPLLGWYRYLKTVPRVAGRYDVRLIVLCPEVVYRSGLVCGRNIVAVNGEDELVQLVQVLTQTELNNFQKGDNEDNQKVIWPFFWRIIFCRAEYLTPALLCIRGNMPIMGAVLLTLTL